MSLHITAMVLDLKVTEVKEKILHNIFVYLLLVVEQCKVDRGNWQISGRRPISLKTIPGMNVD